MRALSPSRPTGVPCPRTMVRGGARDPISVRTSLPQTLQQQQDLARIVPVAGVRLAAPLFPPSCPLARSPEPHYPIRDLWIIARLIPPARSKRESIAEDEDSIRFDAMMYRRRRTGVTVSNRFADLTRRCVPSSFSRVRNQNGSDHHRSKKWLIEEQKIRISNFWSVR